MYKKILFFLLVNTLSFSYINAQEDCTIILKKAQKLYDEGAIEKVPNLLNACLEKGLSTEEKLQALKLVTLTYLFEDKQSLA